MTLFLGFEKCYTENACIQIQIELQITITNIYCISNEIQPLITGTHSLKKSKQLVPDWLFGKDKTPMDITYISMIHFHFCK